MLFHPLFLTAFDSLKNFFNIMKRLNFDSLESFWHSDLNIIALANKTLQFLIDHIIVHTFADILVLLHRQIHHHVDLFDGLLPPQVFAWFRDNPKSEVYFA
jgi:hypothetical protein